MYDSYYGLSGRPFQLTPDPEFYFESNTHRKAMSYLGYGLAQGEGFIVITGEIGAGKTTLVGHLMATVDKARLTAAQIVTTQLPGNDLLHMVAGAFGVQTEGRDKTATLKAIEQFLQEEAREGRRCLLIIDESQNLPIDAIEELRMLSNFQLGSHPLLQIFLLGQPEFRDTVQRSPDLEQLRQRIIATHHLDAMGKAEVAPYIEHRLKCVGWNGRPEFTQDAYDRLFAESEGIPRKLNGLANRIMLMAAVEQIDTISGALVDRVLADLDRDAGRAKSWNDESKLADYDSVAAVDRPQDLAEISDDTEEDELPPVVDPVEFEQPRVEERPIATAEDVSFDETAVADEVEDTTDDRPIIEDECEPAASMADLAELQAQFRALTFERATVKSVDDSDFRLAVERICALEGRLLEQEQALRRVLTLLIDWVENDENSALGSRAA